MVVFGSTWYPIMRHAPVDAMIDEVCQALDEARVRLLARVGLHMAQLILRVVQAKCVFECLWQRGHSYTGPCLRDGHAVFPQSGAAACNWCAGEKRVTQLVTQSRVRISELHVRATVSSGAAPTFAA